MSKRQVRVTSTAANTAAMSNRANLLTDFCATISDSPAPMSAASMAFVALARSCSTASRCAPVCCSPCKPTARA